MLVWLSTDVTGRCARRRIAPPLLRPVTTASMQEDANDAVHSLSLPRASTQLLFRSAWLYLRPAMINADLFVHRPTAFTAR